MNITREFVGRYISPPPKDFIIQAIAMLEPATTELLEEAAAVGVPPQQIFERYAHEEYTRVGIEQGHIAA
jgi:hypothetical protein